MCFFVLRRQVNRLCFLIHLTCLCHVIGELRSLIFRVIDECVFITATVFLIFDVFVCVVVLVSLIIVSFAFLLQSLGYAHSSLQSEILLPVFSLDLVCWFLKKLGCLCHRKSFFILQQWQVVLLHISI